MKFTALEEYGLRCILHLARREYDARSGARSGSAGERISVTLGEVADDEGLTQQYAGKIFRVLAKSGLVESERGRKGGYRLVRPPEDTTLSEVITALGGRLFERKLCARFAGDRLYCVHVSNCAIRLLWMELQRVVDQVLEKSTLRDLVEREKNMAAALKTLPRELALVIPGGEELVMPRGHGEEGSTTEQGNEKT